MGDSDNTLPPVKKRAADRELSRDNPGLDDDDDDDDDEEETTGQETGTFKRASDDVLANRRIVTVKRGQRSSTPYVPSSNPFAGICLVPPATSTPASEPEKLLVNDENAPATEKGNDGKIESLAGNDESTPASEKDNCENRDTLVGNDENAPAAEEEKDEKKENLVENDEIAPAAEKGNNGKIESLAGNDKITPASEKENCENRGTVGNDENAPAAEKGKDEKKEDLVENDGTIPASEKENDGEKVNTDGNDEKTPVTGSVNSFQQLSSSQNAFTGLAGTGFSTSSFSFWSTPQPDPPVFPSFGFGTNGNSSLFSNTDKNTEGTKTTPAIMQEVQVETGEENEKVVFTSDSILFEFIDGSWKERGKGELKVNVLTSGTRKARLVMRARGNYRLILNASIFPDMKLTNMDKKGITFACLNSTGEGQNGLSTFALKFKDASVVEQFRSVVMAHKGNSSSGVVNLKTPENSPKGSEE